MGGNALKDIETRRYEKDEYDLLCKKIISYLKDNYNIPSLVIPSYSDKSDFGDLDLLVEKESLIEANLFNPNPVVSKKNPNASKFEKLINLTASDLNSRSFHVNDNILSFEYRPDTKATIGFQVDLIVIPKDEMDVCLSYFSFNDLGNLMGRIAHKLGLSHGHRGLEYYFRDGDHLVSKISVSKDMKDIFNFLDYDYEKFKSGFKNLKEIYEFTTSSKYFNPEVYLLENRNHKSRARDRKRSTYRGFLEYISEKDFKDVFIFDKDKSVYLPMIKDYFPEFKDKYDNTLIKLETSKQLKEVFNGHNISSWLGIDGKYLSKFMSHLRSMWSDDTDLLSFIQRHGEQGLKNKALAQFDAYQKDHPYIPTDKVYPNKKRKNM